MNTEELISLNMLATHFEVDMSFFSRLGELELIEIFIIEQSPYVHKDTVGDVERMIRMHVELDINLEGIDTIFHLLGKIERLEAELREMKSRLRFYEDDL